jgi:hypothetical protein
MNTSIVRAERVTFQLTPSPKHAIVFFKFPDGEKRVGLAGVASACGLNKNYFSRLQSATPDQLKALQGMGFDGYSREAFVERLSLGGRGSAKSKTLSLDDFRTFVRFAAFTLHTPEALALASGLLGVAIETIAKQAFGEEALTLEEIRRHLCKEYAKTIDWTKEDRYDAEEIENHQLFLAGD